MRLDVLNETPLTPIGREALFSAAALAFAGREEADGIVPAPPDDLGGPVFDTPLLVVIAAYLDVHGGGGAHDRTELLEELVGHEDRYWRASGPDAPTDPVLRKRIVTLATLAGAGSEAEAAEHLRLVPDLAHADEGRRRALARW